MKLIRIKAIAKKELIQIWRDPLSLALAFLMPMILLVIFGYAITFDINNINTVVCDLDRSGISRELVAELGASGYFKVIAQTEDCKDIDAFLDRGQAKVAVMIPTDFSKELRAGRTARVEVILDGSDSNTATIAQGYIVSLFERYSRRQAGGRAAPLIDARSRVWYNPELKSRNFIIPGLIAVIMAVIVALLTSLTVSKEWERGTMEQLISTPVKTPELIIGKIVPYFFIGFIDTAAAVVMGTVLFHVPLRGSAVLLFSLAGVFLFGGLSWGVLISIIARSQLLSSQMAMVSTFLPAFLLSGFMFTITNLPKVFQAITYIVPARYFVTILKSVFLKGSHLNLLVMESLLLAVYGTLVFTVAVKKFRKKVA